MNVREVRCALLGLASGLALAVRPAGLAEVSGVNGAPQARSARQSREVKELPTNNPSIHRLSALLR